MLSLSLIPKRLLILRRQCLREADQVSKSPLLKVAADGVSGCGRLPREAGREGKEAVG